MSPNQNAAQGFYHMPQEVGNYSSTQAAFFENISRGVWYYYQYVNIYCVSFTFITFIRYPSPLVSVYIFHGIGGHFWRICGTIDSVLQITL